MNIFTRLKSAVESVFQGIQNRIGNLVFIDKLSEFYIESLEKIQSSEYYNKILAAYSNLNENEKKVVNLSGLVVAAFLILIVVFSSLSYLNSYSARIEKADRIISEIKSVKNSLRSSEAAIKSLKRVFKSTSDFKMASFVEKVASDVGIQSIDSFNARGSTKKEYINITNYVIKLSKIHLRNLVDFAYGLENSGHPAFITSLKMTRLFSNIKYFDIEMVVAHKEISKEVQDAK